MNKMKNFTPLDEIINKGVNVYKKTNKANTDTDIYYQTDYKLKDSNVAIPTYDSVIEAKTWVDDENKR